MTALVSVVNYSFAHYTPTRTYVANLVLSNESALVIASEAIPLPTRPDIHRVGDFKHAVLFGQDVSIEAKIVGSQEGEAVFLSNGRISQQELAAYFDAAIAKGQEALADYFKNRVNMRTLEQRYYNLSMAAAIRGPPHEVMAKLREGKLKSSPIQTE